MFPHRGLRILLGVTTLCLLVLNYLILTMEPYIKRRVCKSDILAGCSLKIVGASIGASIGAVIVLTIFCTRIRPLLVYYFPVTCGHRRFIFTGRSSKPLIEILLSVDNKIPTEVKLQEFKDKALRYLNDIKIPLEQTMGTFEYIFSGSTVERFGIPLMMSYNTVHMSLYGEMFLSIDPLYSDLDVMFCSLEDKASFIGNGNILIKPLVTQGEGFKGYAKLTSLTPGYENYVSSDLIREKAKDAVGKATVSYRPRGPCCCIKIPHTRETDFKLEFKGPTIKINMAPLFEVDITICIQCPEWPSMSDWPSRLRYWPSVADAQRIMSLGCHLVAKSAPDDEYKRTWRFSFSLAEVELSKLVPDTARKCFLALKIILKDHLQPVVPEISSYHIKTIFFNTLEKVPVGFWVDENIEECFLTLPAELRDSLLCMNCRHHWFSFINLFDMGANDMQRLGKKVERIMKDPAPFILDDCCCLAPCCVRVPKNNFTRRSSEQFLADYDEVTLSADGHMVATERQGCQLPVPQSPRANSEDQIDPNTYSIEDQGHEQLVVSLPPLQDDAHGLTFRPREVEDDWLRDALPLLVIFPPEQNA